MILILSNHHSSQLRYMRSAHRLNFVFIHFLLKQFFSHLIGCLLALNMRESRKALKLRVVALTTLNIVFIDVSGKLKEDI